MNETRQILIIKKYNLYYFIKMCLIFCLFNFLEISDAFSMDEGENPSYHSLSKAKAIESSAGELIPLITIINREEDSHLYSFIQKYLVQQEDISEPNRKKILRFGARGLSVVLGSLAGVPYFEVAKEAGGINVILGWGLGITNTIATSGTGAWAFFNILKGFDPQSEEERILLQESKLPILGHLTAHSLGLVVAVPTAYMASIYNTHKWLASISYLLDYGLKTSGYLNFFEKVIAEKSKIKCSLLGGGDQELIEIDQSLQNIQKLLIHHLSYKVIPALLTMSDEERDQLIESIYQKDNLKAETYLESLFNVSSPSTNPFRETPNTWNKGYPKTAFISSLSLSAFLNVFHNGICAYKAWQMLYDHYAFTIPMATISTIPIFILELQATIETGRSLYDAAFYRISGNPQPSLFQTLYPTFSRVLPYVCIPLAGVTAYVGRFMVVDILKDILPQEGLRLSLAVGGFIGPFLFAAYANYSVMQDLLLSYIRSYGETSEKKLALLIQDIEKLSNIMSLTQKEEIEKFVKHPNIQSLISRLNSEETREEIPHNQEEKLDETSNNNCVLF